MELPRKPLPEKHPCDNIGCVGNVGLRNLEITHAFQKNPGTGQHQRGKDQPYVTQQAVSIAGDHVADKELPAQSQRYSDS